MIRTYWNRLLNQIWKPNATFYVNFSRKPQISNEKGRRHNNYVPKSCGPRKRKKSLSLRKFRIRPPVLVPQKCWTPKEIGCSTQPISPYFYVDLSMAGRPWTYIIVPNCLFTAIYKMAAIRHVFWSSTASTWILRVAQTATHSSRKHCRARNGYADRREREKK